MEARTAFFFGGEHGGGGGDDMYFLVAGSTAAKAGTAFCFWQGGRVFVFGSGTAKAKWHRRRDLRANRLPLHLFDSNQRVLCQKKIK